jgi:hypothetical protein
MDRETRRITSFHTRKGESRQMVSMNRESKQHYMLTDRLLHCFKTSINGSVLGLEGQRPFNLNCLPASLMMLIGHPQSINKQYCRGTGKRSVEKKSVAKSKATCPQGRVAEQLCDMTSQLSERTLDGERKAKKFHFLSCLL